MYPNGNGPPVYATALKIEDATMKIIIGSYDELQLSDEGISQYIPVINAAKSEMTHPRHVS